MLATVQFRILCLPEHYLKIKIYKTIILIVALYGHTLHGSTHVCIELYLCENAYGRDPLGSDT
jgi:hypothetical protein